METPRPPAPDFGNLDVAQIDELLDALEPEELDLSAKRRRAHDRIDNVRADVRSGIDAYPSLARLEIWERRLSAERRALHACIDALYRVREQSGAPPRRPVARRGPELRTPTLLDPDGGRSGTLEHLAPLDRPLDDRLTLGYGSRRHGPPEKLDRGH